MPRFSFLIIVSLLLISVGHSVGSARPNFLIIMADDLGYETLGCYGGQDYQTPELDTMAAQGLRFSRAYVEPVCTPTRVSLHTGLYVQDHGHFNVLPVHNGTSSYVNFDAMPTFAQLFQADGYQTSTTGKWQLATLTENPNHIADAGFDSWCVWQIWDGSAKTTRYWNPYLNRDGSVLQDIDTEFGPDVIADYVKERMATAVADGEPFMIVHNELLPHVPIVDTPDGSASLGNMIGYMDKLVGELLDEVDTLGIRDNTYVIFIGDNGTDTGVTRHTVNGDVTGGKRDLSDSGTHAPFIVWGPPGIPVGVNDDLIHITDVLPTACSLAGIEIPASIEYRGRSFVPQLEGRAGRPREWVTAGNGGYSVFDGEWRLNTSGKIYDSRNLPVETEITEATIESEAAREKLERIFDYINGNLSSASGAVIDNLDSESVTVQGEWKNSSSTNGYQGSDYLHDLNVGQGTKSVTFHYTPTMAGSFTLDLRWTTLSNRASNVPVDVITPGDLETFTVNQRSNGGQWNTLTTVSLNAGEEVMVRLRTDGVDGYVIADAVRVQTVGAQGFLEWKSMNFDLSTLLNPALENSIWGDDADPDADGLSNLLEYALGGQPLGRNAQMLGEGFNWNSSERLWRLILRKNNAAVSTELEYATGLTGGWDPADTLFTVVKTVPIDLFHDEVTIAYTGSEPIPSPLFVRFNVIAN